MAEKKKKWISGAISKPGALTKQAHAAGESPMEFARSHQSSPGVTGKRARLAMTLQGFHRGGGHKRSHVVSHLLRKKKG